MNDLVTSETVIEPFLDVVRDQVARGKPFFDTLSKTLDVQADYNVSHLASVPYSLNYSIVVMIVKKSCRVYYNFSYLFNYNFLTQVPTRGFKNCSFDVCSFHCCYSSFLSPYFSDLGSRKTTNQFC